MGLSNRQSGDRATPVAFMNVSQIHGYVPSWLPPQRQGARDAAEMDGVRIASPPSPPCDIRELVDAAVDGDGEVSMSRHSNSAVAVAKEADIATPDLDAILEERLALEAATRETQRLNAELAEAVARTARSREAMLDDAARQVVDLAMLAARRIMLREARLDPSVLRNLVREALRVLSEREPVKVRVGRGFEPATRAVASILAQEVGEVAFIVDPALEEFGCVVQTDLASVDESLERRFDALVESLESGGGE